jgi:hypothetical protein
MNRYNNNNNPNGMGDNLLINIATSTSNNNNRIKNNNNNQHSFGQRKFSLSPPKLDATDTTGGEPYLEQNSGAADKQPGI